MNRASTPVSMCSSSSRSGMETATAAVEDKAPTSIIDRRMEDKHFLQAYHQLRKSVTCAICLELFCHPVALPCSHVFCQNCIKEACKQREQCPMCAQKPTAAQLRSCLYSNPIVDIQHVLALLKELFESIEPQQNFSQSPALDDFHFQPLKARRPPLSIGAPSSSSSRYQQNNYQVNQGYLAPTLAPSSSSRTPEPSAAMAPTLPPAIAPSAATAAASSSKLGIAEQSRETSPISLDAISAAELNQLVAEAPSPPVARAVHEVGSLVNVLPRTWVGINKLGGVARVDSFIIDDSTDVQVRYYKVKYVLDGTQEENIHEVFVEPFVELSREKRRQSRGSNASTASITSPTPPPPPKSARKMRDITTTMMNQGIGGESALSSASKRPRKDKEAVFGGKENTTITDPGNEEQLSSNSPSSSSTASKQYVLLTTAIEDPHVFEKKLEKLVTACDHVTVLTQYTPEVTHLIVSCDKHDKSLMKQRTMKYMQCVVKGCFVLSTQWVQDSLKAKKLLPEADYEIEQNTKATLTKAPQRARESIATGHLLLQGYNILLFGGFPLPGPQRTDIQALCAQGGSYATEHVDQFLHAFLSYIQRSNDEAVQYDTLMDQDIALDHWLVVCSNSASYTKNDILDKLKRYLKKGDSNSSSSNVNRDDVDGGVGDGILLQAQYLLQRIQVVNVLWVLDSATNYAVQPLQSYLVATAL